MSPAARPSNRTLAIGGGVVVAVLIAGLGLFFATRSSDSQEATTDTTLPPETSTTTTTQPPGPIAPLTGIEDPTGAVATRCAVSVKVGNTADAHPQYGIAAADVVYEGIADGGVTRLLAVYQSQAPDQVGSVRSVRPTDQYILTPLRGVFAFSGGNSYELASLDGVPVVKLDETTAGPMMFRGSDRRAPNNLYAHVDQMYERCEDPPPPALFTYRAEGTPSAGIPIASVGVGFGLGYETTWDWNAANGEWMRGIFGGPDTDVDGTQLGMTNVVVMRVDYPPDASGTTVRAEMMGSGPVAVFSDGKVVTGTWERPDIATAATLVDANGQPIVLTPGRTWVELLPTNAPLTTVPG